MKKLLILTTLLASMTLVACGNDDPGSNPPAPGPTGVNLDINKETAKANLINLGKTTHFEISYIDYSIPGTETNCIYGSSGEKMYWEKDINGDSKVHEVIINESENTEYDRYTLIDGNYVKSVVSTTVESESMYNAARDFSNSKFFIAHILDGDQVYTRKNSTTLAGRDVRIFDYDSEHGHERFLMDIETGICLSDIKYSDASKTIVEENIFVVTSFKTGAAVVTPNYK